MTSDRYERQVRLFGREGQRALSTSRVVVVGVGGVGSHVVQQLAYLGVGELFLVDKEELDETNLNRYVTAQHDDPVPGTPKVDIGERLAMRANPDVSVRKLPDTVVSEEAFGAIREADCVFGCVDKEGVRQIVMELCAAYERRFVDIASDVIPSEDGSVNYGGRVCIAWDGPGCLVCYEAFDPEEAARDLEGPREREMRRAIYGVDHDDLDRTGPSVISINGVVASLAVTEFMLGVTGIRDPRGLLTYRGSVGGVSMPSDLPRSDCHICEGTRGKGETAGVERYIRRGVGEHL